MLTLARTTDLHALIADRHSPRSFDPAHELDDESLVTLLEAARWAPSSMNHQPWRLVVARRGTDAHADVFDTLMPGNQRWAGDAAALVVAIAEHSRDGHPIATAQYDLGLAVAQMTTQAQAMGLHVHQMGGFDTTAAREVLSLSDDLVPMVVVAVGRRDVPDRLPDDLRARETAPRSRRPLDETVLSVDGRRWAADQDDDEAAA
ncbi:MAG: nitroreductase family protein [Jiangellales bacterium]